MKKDLPIDGTAIANGDDKYIKTVERWNSKPIGAKFNKTEFVG